MKRVAVLGGTFNPIHYGHLRCAEEVREALGFDAVFFMPLFFPPHKEDKELIGAEKRIEMAGIAIKGNPGFSVSDIEVKRKGMSYTIDTVRELKKEAIEPSIVVGSDSFNEITTWCEYEELFKITDFVVVPRPGYAVKKIAEVVPVELAKKFWYDEVTNSYMNSWGRRVTYVGITQMDISSSAIRKKAKEGGSIKYLVPEAVLEFILSKGLYR